MKILELEFFDEVWRFSPISLKKINLFVGASGSGKTKLLNTIFNIGNFIHNNTNPKWGTWKISIASGKNAYLYEFEAKRATDDRSPPIIVREILSQISGKENMRLIERDEKRFLFLGKEIPKLSPITSGVYLLKEEAAIKPVYDGFGTIYRRSFSGADLANAISQAILPKHAWEMLKKTELPSNKDASALAMFYTLPLPMRLSVLKGKYPGIYKNVCQSFVSVFPNVRELVIRIDRPTGSPFLGDTPYSPIAEVKEKGVTAPVSLADLSSGMQKVLLLIVDLLTLPDETIYMLDEYENSLGINAINFLPEFLDDFGGNKQFILTTHHPYLINKISVSNWYVFSRHGAKVAIKQGDELKNKYAKSAQEAFTQLINDPFYAGKEK